MCYFYRFSKGLVVLTKNSCMKNSCSSFIRVIKVFGEEFLALRIREGFLNVEIHCLYDYGGRFG